MKIAAAYQDTKPIMGYGAQQPDGPGLGLQQMQCRSDSRDSEYKAAARQNKSPAAGVEAEHVVEGLRIPRPGPIFSTNGGGVEGGVEVEGALGSGSRAGSSSYRMWRRQQLYR